MSSIFQYRSLFSVQVLIDYYLTEEAALYQDTPDNPMATVLQEQFNRYNLEDDLLIVPTDETRKLLSDNRLLFKRNNLGFFVSSQVSQLGDGLFVPFTPLDEPLHLRFAVYLQNSHFFNYTNIRLESELANKDSFIYYFSNRANNVINNDVLYLSDPVPDFNASYAYEASEIFIDTADPLDTVMLEAIENNGPGSFSSSSWRQLFNDVNPLPQFVTTSDRIVSRPSSFKVDVENVGEDVLAFLISDENSALVKTVVHRTSEAGTPLEQCELDLGELRSGHYNLEVQNALGNPFPELAFTFFMDDGIHQKRPFALIECIHEPDGSLGAYRWLDQTNENRLLFPEYTIRWKNRSTWWRYYHETAPEFTSGILENLDPDPNSPNNRILISTDPLALTHLGREIAVTLDNGDLRLLPNPDARMIYPEDGRIYSELNMGGGIGPPD